MCRYIFDVIKKDVHKKLIVLHSPLNVISRNVHSNETTLSLISQLRGKSWINQSKTDAIIGMLSSRCPPGGLLVLVIVSAVVVVVVVIVVVVVLVVVVVVV